MGCLLVSSCREPKRKESYIVCLCRVKPRTSISVEVFGRVHKSCNCHSVEQGKEANCHENNTGWCRVQIKYVTKICNIVLVRCGDVMGV